MREVIIGDANAVVGRPATPVRYAGIARRTARRTVRRTAYATVPAQQTTDGDVYVCANTQYQAAYDGDTVVYQQM
jgi:hypothetical protein